MRLILGLFFTCFLFNNALFSQDLDFQWVESTSTSGIDNTVSSVIDEEGSVYSTGYFRDTLHYTINGVNGFFVNSNSLAADVYIEKRTSEGDVVWMKHLGSSNADFGGAIRLDHFGNVIVLGSFSDDMDGDPGVGVDSLFDVLSTQDRFILKLKADDGDFVWVKHVYGHFPSSFYNNNLRVDLKGNIYHSGLFVEDFDMDPSEDTSLYTANGGADLFIQKLDSNGEFIWGKQIEVQSSSYYNHHISNAIDVNMNNEVIIAGSYRDTVDLDPGIGVDFAYSPDQASMFVMKLNDSGDLIWSKNIQGNGSIFRCPELKVGYDNQIHLQGYFNDTVDFDPGVGVEELYPDNSINNAVFVLTLDNNGNYVWANTIQGSATTDAMDINVDVFGNVYSSCTFSLSIDIPTINGVSSHTSAGTSDVLIVKYDSSGEAQWGKHFGGSQSDQVSSLAVDLYGTTLYVSGYFQGIADFDPSSLTYNLTSDGLADGYLSKLASCESASTDSYTQCEPLTWLDGNTYTAPSFYEASFTLTNAQGCDSTVYLELLNHDIDSTITMHNDTLIANQTGATYQWLNCEEGYAEIPGETSINFIPHTQGAYAVEITYENCTVVSECMIVQWWSTPENLVDNINLYSKPIEDMVYLDLGELNHPTQVRVYNILGQSILNTQFTDGGIKEIQLNNSKGVYLIDVRINQVNRQFKLVKH